MTNLRRAHGWYNGYVPTPFYHLSLSEELLRSPGLPEPARHLLHQQRSAFLLGNTAPDVQTVSGQSRQATHFFVLPSPPGASVPWEALFTAHPALSDAGQLPPAQAAFIAGYVCHLHADWLWVHTIFEPVFGLQANWNTLNIRLYRHNVLRAYLDRKILPGLTNGGGKAASLCASLESASPQAWLPFVADAKLRLWRDFLAGQLKPGAASQTVEVFAARQGIPPGEYYRLLDSEARMDEEVFSHLPRPAVETYHQHVLVESLHFLQYYLKFARPDQHPGLATSVPASVAGTISTSPRIGGS